MGSVSGADAPSLVVGVRRADDLCYMLALPSRVADLTRLRRAKPRHSSACYAVRTPCTWLALLSRARWHRCTQRDERPAPRRSISTSRPHRASICRRRRHCRAATCPKDARRYEGLAPSCCVLHGVRLLPIGVGRTSRRLMWKMRSEAVERARSASWRVWRRSGPAISVRQQRRVRARRRGGEEEVRRTVTARAQRAFAAAFATAA